ncbi:upstream activation factor subunit spp27-like isoform X1 [Solanum dulcamara]|uniref:upstream activation factor subunit spp27-like isoform X1 n=1 Tax=Solanum dulcamara TaxID=45834 RepID=UPI0024859F91|nr:upstream activation factor subunit spp27-like isoform X1 [Solanum dulcamara]
MVSDSELVGRLREFLSTSDLNTTSNAAVRRKLEEDFGIDLSDRKVFIRDQIDLYLESEFQNEKNEEEMKEENDEGPSAEVKSEVSEEEEDPEEEEEEEVEESESVAKGKRKSSKKKPGKKNENVKRKAGGFTKVCSLSPQLQKFTGETELARTEVVKRMWRYIRENNLQDPSNRRNINCDDTLRELFDVDTINMFQMNKALAKHIWPLDCNGVSTITTSDSVNSTAKEKSSTAKKKRQKQEEDEDSDEPKRKEKRKNSGILAPLQLSDALIKFLGTGESELPRSDVVKRIWEYIKQNDLQDPSDKRQIICDEKLKELFDVETFNGFGVAKLLTPHFIKAER